MEIETKIALELLFKSIQELKTNDSHLLKIHKIKNSENLNLKFDKIASERSINAKISHYLTVLVKKNDEISSYTVDVEYNLNYQNENNSKILEAIKKLKEKSTGFVYPALIVHRRNSHFNLLVVELKKKQSSKDRTTFDKEKLKAYTDEMGYKLGILLIYTSNENDADFEFKYFHSGKELDCESECFKEIEEIRKSILI